MEGILYTFIKKAVLSFFISSKALWQCTGSAQITTTALLHYSSYAVTDAVLKEQEN